MSVEKETTLGRVTDKIMELCSRIVSDAKSEYIQVEAQGWCLPMECFPNVERMAREHGGQQVNGWAIW